MPRRRSKTGNGEVVQVEVSYVKDQLVVRPHTVRLHPLDIMFIVNMTDDCLKWEVPKGPFSAKDPHRAHVNPRKPSNPGKRALSTPGMWKYAVTAAGKTCPKKLKRRKLRFVEDDPVIIIEDSFRLTAAQAKRRARADKTKRRRPVSRGTRKR